MDRPYSRDELLDRLLVRANLPSAVTIKTHTYRLEGDDVLGTGLSSVVWKAVDEYGRPRALKFCPTKLYPNSSPLEEAYRASQLEPCDTFAAFVDVDTLNFELGTGQQHSVICFVEHFVPGVTLHTFLTESAEQATPSFLLAYVRGMCTGLQALYQLHLRHNDLHDRNVMIAQPPLGDLSAEPRIKIIDTGNIRSSAPNTYDDHRSFVTNLISIWNTILRQRHVVVRDRRFLKAVIPLLNLMLDEDGAIALREPSQILLQFDKAYQRAMVPPRDTLRELNSPFEFISADHIADDRLLVELFAASCPWLDKVSGPDPCLVTGPRGCGKSTIFRWLSLKAHLHKSAAEIDRDLRITGFYLSSSTDLQNRLSWIRTTDEASNLRGLIVHYFNLIASREVLKTLAMIARHSERESYWGFGSTAEKAIYEFITAVVGAGNRVRLQGVSRIEQAQEIVEAELFAVQLDLQTNTVRERSTTPSFLGDFTALLAGQMPRLQEKTIVFLLDDFSTHRVSEPVQVVLNQIIWERRPSHVFKLSSEKHGAVLNDELLASSEITRERLEIDCGQEYLTLSDAHQERKTIHFATELLNNRLRSARYTGTADVLIGHSRWPDRSLAKALAEKSNNPRRGCFHGVECIAQLCSGDVASLLQVYSTVFAAANVNKSTVETIAPHIQHRAIVEVSRKLREVIKTYYPYGREMYDLVLAFGNLVARVLRDGKLQHDGDPTQIPRIEIDQPAGDVTQGLSSAEQDLAWELVRGAIFIEMEPGLSRHRKWSTLRWNLRRIYLPAFGAALSKNDAVKRGPDWFADFLKSPARVCEDVWRAWPKRELASESESDDYPLFESEQEGA